MATIFDAAEALDERATRMPIRRVRAHADLVRETKIDFYREKIS